MASDSRYRIGLFDSGLGGLSVLESLWKELGNIDFVYYSDLQNSPYGSLSKEKVIELSENAFRYLQGKDCKAVLFACNTATSAAAGFLRDTHKIPIFGMEPAVKPASLSHPNKPVAIFATELTLKEEKFKNLLDTLPKRNNYIAVPCEGLAKLIDECLLDEAWDLLNGKILSVIKETDVFVLGCTHYVFLKERILKHYPDVSVYEGNSGTAIHIKNVLGLNSRGQNHLEIFLNTSNEKYIHTTNLIVNKFAENSKIVLIDLKGSERHV
ncbi:glutamate racemase [Leptospira ilyithenensis]|uniref:Glutamate racemase n=1 Tax=Leptospira ilyithenensis TaxID=2484901 RepID=A0A4R9LQJ3_9LEPT|nr:glutamate racemase [Leptospira ilyithenensis]TGN10376.1 glutamate racemase [Leptospira ilyithenensis]